VIEHGTKSEVVEANAMLRPLVIGTRLTSVARSEGGWLFSFAPAWEVRTGTYWRLIAGGALAVSGEDYGQLFGLREPFDAAAHLRSTLVGSVSDIEIAVDAADLRIHFGEDRLELFNTSAGYEGWMLTSQVDLIAKAVKLLGDQEATRQ
jgi:hypothetical protein